MKLLISDFSGGISDYVHKFQRNFCEVCDNLLIDKDVGLYQRNGINLFNTTYNRVSDQSRIDSMIPSLDDDILLKTANKLYRLNTTGFSEIQGQGSRSIIYNHSEEEHIDWDILNDEIIITSDERKFEPLTISRDSDYEGVTAGLPSHISDPTLGSAGSGNAYIYAFVRYRTYTVNGTIREVFSAPLFVEHETNNPIDGSNTVAISDITSYTNAVNEFFPTGTSATDMKTRVYRTTKNGTVFYYLGDSAGLVANGTTTTTDNVPDATLQNNVLLYTQGDDVPFNDAPPAAKYVTVAKDSAFYANSSTNTTRVWQSKPLQPGAVPTDNFVDVDEPIVAIATTRGFPIVFTENKVFRIEGFIDALGRGSLQKRVITDRVGSIGFRSVVNTRNGVYFAAADGWYFTDGYQAKNISEQIELRYRDLSDTATEKSRMNAIYWAVEQKVLFSTQVKTGDNDVIYVYDERFDAWTTMSGQTTLNPTSMLYKDNMVYYGDDDGYLYKFDSNQINDVKKDTSVATSSWDEEAVIYDWKHVNENFGDYDTNKWVPKVTIQTSNESGLHLQPSTFDNDDTAENDLAPIVFQGFLPWGRSGFAWGDSGFTWRKTSASVKTRKFPRGTLRTKRKQLRLTNQTDGVLHYSDDFGAVTINTTSDQITLDDSSKAWNSKIVGYNIVIAGVTYPITHRISSTVIQVLDSGGNLPTSATSWEVQGIIKDEFLRLQAITYSYLPLSDRGQYGDFSEGNSA